MEKVIISSKACRENKISLGELFCLLAVCECEDIFKTLRELNLKSLIGDAHKDDKLQYFLMYNGAELIKNVIADSIELKETGGRDMVKLATALKEVFPTGKKDGTNNYWAEGVQLIVRRLKIFFKKYGEDFTDQQLIDAAKKYVESFNGNYSYMRTLKYFIFKEVRGAGGDIESTSDLLNYIENKDQPNTNNDWVNELI